MNKIENYVYFNFRRIFFRIFEFFGNCDLDLIPKVTIFEFDLTTDIRHHLTKTASKSIKWFARQRANRQTDRQKVCGKIVGERQLSLNVLYEVQAVQKASAIEKDVEHILSKYFEKLPSGRRYRTLKGTKNRTRASFLYKSIVLLNKR